MLIVLIKKGCDYTSNMGTSVVVLESGVWVLLEKWQNMLMNDVVPVPHPVQITVYEDQVGAVVSSEAAPRHDAASKKAVYLSNASVCIAFSSTSKHHCSTIMVENLEPAFVRE